FYLYLSKNIFVFAVDTYLSNGLSVIAVQRAFRRHFELPREETWDVSKRKKGPTRSVTTPENVERVRRSLLQCPRRSARKHAIALGMSARSLRRIVHDELHFNPYKMILAQQQLAESDYYVTRQRSCEELVDTLPKDALVFFSDEAHFHLSGSVIKENMRYWSETNPREHHEGPLHSDCHRVVCHFKSRGHRSLLFSGKRSGCNREFRQLLMIPESFSGRLISLGGDVNWSARSPDLAPCDYFLWGYLKSLVYKDRPQTLDDLVDQNFRNRLNQCIDNGGRHLKDILSKLWTIKPPMLYDRQK
uniref:DUF4817 domain-containing protein n=1 Tax=Neogobius melanostomus TaxID=47308 RepID=A0A8C6WVP8_9GOBI